MDDPTEFDPKQLITLYVCYLRVNARLHIVRAEPGKERETPALCGHQWGRWATEEWPFRPGGQRAWCSACLKAEKALT